MVASKAKKKEIQQCQICSIPTNGLQATPPVDNDDGTEKTQEPQQHQQKEAKYRCPNCHIRYCSVACFKQHKEIGPCEKQDRPLPSSHGVKRSRQVSFMMTGLFALLVGYIWQQT